MARISYGDVRFRDGIAEFEIDGNTIIIDEEDINLLLDRDWRVSFPREHLPVARATIGRRGYITMQEIILEHKSSRIEQIDHINRNSLDNRKANLRVVGQEEQSQNRRSWCKAGYKGVTYDGRWTPKWRARITVEGGQMFLGNFNTPEKAAFAYNEAAKKYYGENACLNELTK